MFNFESIEDLADFAEYLAEESRKKANVAKAQRDKQAFILEAEAYKHFEEVIRASNLIKGRLVLVDDELDEARKEVQLAIDTVNTVRGYLGTIIDNLNEKLNELEVK